MSAMLSEETVLTGRYRITEVVAHGGMGVVYQAMDERLRRPVAVKTVGSDDPALIARLRREARLLAQVSHPNVVRLYDVTEHDGQYCLISELVEGTPLGPLRGQLDTVRIAAIAEQIAGALAAAHARGIVHRDLKPSNVVVGDRVRLLDFGIARHIDDPAHAHRRERPGHGFVPRPRATSSGEVAGPPVDIYALRPGAHRAVPGEPAFAGTFAETIAARLVGPPELPASMPVAWRPLVRTMVDPRSRTAADGRRRREVHPHAAADVRPGLAPAMARPTQRPAP